MSLAGRKLSAFHTAHPLSVKRPLSGDLGKQLHFAVDGSAGVDHTPVQHFPRAPQPEWVGGGQISTSETLNTGVIDPVHDGTAQFQAHVLGHKLMR